MPSGFRPRAAFAAPKEGLAFVNSHPIPVPLSQRHNSLELSGLEPLFKVWPDSLEEPWSLTMFMASPGVHTDTSVHLQQLQLLGRFCQEQGIPFPPITPSPEQECQPQECHLFAAPDQPEAPVVLHFPLVNSSFREHSAPGESQPLALLWRGDAFVPSMPVCALSTGVRRTPEEAAAGEVNLSPSDSPYHYTQVTYSEEDADKLLRLTHYNVCNNREQLLDTLRQAVQRRQQRRPQ